MTHNARGHHSPGDDVVGEYSGGRFLVSQERLHRAFVELRGGRIRRCEDRERTVAWKAEILRIMVEYSVGSMCVCQAFV